MKVFFNRVAVRGTGAAGVLLTLIAGAALAADDLPMVREIRMPSVNVDVDVDIDGIGRPSRSYPGRPFASLLPRPPFAEPGIGIVEPPAIAPHQVSAILQSNGYAPLGPVTRRGWVYTMSAIDPRGDDGRVIIDARTGRIVRFIPAYAVSDNLNEQLQVVYGPPGPPPVIEPPRAGRVPLAMPRAASSPLASTRASVAPKVAGRTAPATSGVTPRVSTAPVSTARSDRLAIGPAQRAAMNQIKPARAAPPAEAKPLAAKPTQPVADETTPAATEIRPTSEMPAVQGLE